MRKSVAMRWLGRFRSLRQYDNGGVVATPKKT